MLECHKDKSNSGPLPEFATISEYAASNSGSFRRLATASELELYLRNIGSIRRNGAWFFSLDYMRLMMKILKTVQSAGRYFIVGYFNKTHCERPSHSIVPCSQNAKNRLRLENQRFDQTAPADYKHT